MGSREGSVPQLSPRELPCHPRTRPGPLDTSQTTARARGGPAMCFPHPGLRLQLFCLTPPRHLLISQSLPRCPCPSPEMPLLSFKIISVKCCYKVEHYLLMNVFKALQVFMVICSVKLFADKSQISSRTLRSLCPVIHVSSV